MNKIVNPKKAEKEIEEIFNSGLKFKFKFDWNSINKLNIAINLESCSIKDIISVLEDNEVINFMLNDGRTWDLNKKRFVYDEKYDGSIYWKNDIHGDCIRVDSSMNSLQNWVGGLNRRRKINEILKNDEKSNNR